MKNLLKSIAPILFLLFSLCGCSKIGEKNASLSIIYFAAAILSLLMLIICCVFIRKLKVWYVILFSSVLIVNIGYSILSVSNNVTEISNSISSILNNNDISYEDKTVLLKLQKAIADGTLVKQLPANANINDYQMIKINNTIFYIKKDKTKQYIIYGVIGLVIISIILMIAKKR